MSNFYQWLVEKLRGRRLSAGTHLKLGTFGCIYSANYQNWHHDPHPLIFCMYSDANITHALNIHYANRNNKIWFAKTIYIIKKAAQNMDGATFYKFLKQQKIDLVKTCYRTYHTNMLNMKMVSAGLTPLDDLAYTNFPDPYIKQLNEMIKPSEMKLGAIQIAYNPEELKNHIIEASNAINITKQRVAQPQQTGTFGKAPYIRG
jgi:hypothetical protein